MERKDIPRPRLSERPEGQGQFLSRIRHAALGIEPRAWGRLRSRTIHRSRAASLFLALLAEGVLFRDMKGPLMERPIFRQLERRVETHIFLCVLADHLLVSIEIEPRPRTTRRPNLVRSD
jgi:hypothetical protein